MALVETNWFYVQQNEFPDYATVIVGGKVKVTHSIATRFRFQEFYEASKI